MCQTQGAGLSLQAQTCIRAWPCSGKGHPRGALHRLFSAPSACRLLRVVGQCSAALMRAPQARLRRWSSTVGSLQPRGPGGNTATAPSVLRATGPGAHFAQTRPAKGWFGAQTTCNFVRIIDAKASPSLPDSFQ